MEKANPYLKLAHYILPEEIASSDELVEVKEEVKEFHLYLGRRRKSKSNTSGKPFSKKRTGNRKSKA
jgi:hypothetical protein